MIPRIVQRVGELFGQSNPFVELPNRQKPSVGRQWRSRKFQFDWLRAREIESQTVDSVRTHPKPP
jgi:hypothetical protein